MAHLRARLGESAVSKLAGSPLASATLACSYMLGLWERRNGLCKFEQRPQLNQTNRNTFSRRAYVKILNTRAGKPTREAAVDRLGERKPAPTDRAARYELYEARGRVDGHLEDDWYQAENEIRIQDDVHKAA